MELGSRQIIMLDYFTLIYQVQTGEDKITLRSLRSDI